MPPFPLQIRQIKRAQQGLAGLALLYLVASTRLFAVEEEFQEIAFEIVIDHPGSLGPTPPTRTLIQKLNTKGKPIGAHIDTESVFCGDSECAVVNVRIIWDELGHYDHYELEDGVELEKAEGKPFDEDDHKKLHTILKDRESVLKNVKLDDIQNHEASDESDATSGATPVIYEDAAVKGAAWTTYTLWHWANSDLNGIIRQKTAESLTLEDLLDYLQSDDDRAKMFALAQLIERRHFEPATTESVTRSISKENRLLIKLALQYFEQLDTIDFYTAIENFFTLGNVDQQIIILTYILESKDHSFPTSFVENLSNNLQLQDSYQVIDLLLQVIETRNPPPPRALENTIGLLENKSLLIARRAYWSLSEYNLSKSHSQKLKKFYRTHSGML